MYYLLSFTQLYKKNIYLKVPRKAKLIMNHNKPKSKKWSRNEVKLTEKIITNKLTVKYKN